MHVENTGGRKKVLKLSLQTCKLRLVKYLFDIYLWVQESEDFA